MGWSFLKSSLGKTSKMAHWPAQWLILTLVGSSVEAIPPKCRQMVPPCGLGFSEPGGWDLEVKCSKWEHSRRLILCLSHRNSGRSLLLRNSLRPGQHRLRVKGIRVHFLIGEEWDHIIEKYVGWDFLLCLSLENAICHW